MSRNYKFHKPEGLYFVSFAVVDWLNFFSHHTKGFVREHREKLILEMEEMDIIIIIT